jgi:Abnormal spindle-like microcephaly-assoc'd, ASPM-SPD-2-Hydin
MGKTSRSSIRPMCGLLTLLACLVLTGCAGVSSGSQNSNSNPNQNPKPTAGQLSVTPTTMNFGSVALGSSANLTGTLTAGTADVNVTSAAWSGQGYSVSGITFPVTVAAAKSVTYTVTFAPQAAGNSTGSISFVNDGTTSPVAQTLDGDGGQAGAHTVALSWDASTSSVVGYNVYRGTQSGGPYQKLTSSPQPETSYTDSSVLSATTYYYVATAVDSQNVESTYSNQAQAAVP